MELAVNIPEQEPQVGQAERSYSSTSASLTVGSPATTMVSIGSTVLTTLPKWTLPASMGPPETNTAGMFRRKAAIIIPGVILSQLEMQTRASAQWAFTMYSTESAIISREGRLYNMPSCPMAMPSSMAMVWNSLATPPAFAISSATS